jgi:hypothetical protein
MAVEASVRKILAQSTPWAVSQERPVWASTLAEYLVFHACFVQEETYRDMAVYQKPASGSRARGLRSQNT